MLAMNDDAVCLMNRIVCIAGKRAPTESMGACDLVGASLLAMNDAVCLMNRVVEVAGKRAPTVGLGACDLVGDER